MNQANAFRVIKKMSSTEKAYFKKYAFKKSNAKDNAYHAIFNILDKYADYKVSRIVNNKKIDPVLRKNIHASLNTLYKKLIESLVAYRRSKHKNKIFLYLDEEEVLHEFGLFDLAEKTFVKCKNFAEENNYYFLKPLIYDRYAKLLRNNITINLDKFDDQIANLNRSIDELVLVQRINIIGYQLERLIHVNGGIVVKNDEDYSKIDQLLKEGLEIIPNSAFDFWLQSVLVNNMLILDLMSKNQKFLDYVRESFMQNFNQKIATINGRAGYTNASLVLKNLLVFSIYKNSETVPYLIQKFEALLQTTNIEDAKQFVKERLLQSKLLYTAMSENCVIDEKILKEGLEVYATNTKVLKAHVIEMMVSILIILIQNDYLDQAIDLATDFINISWNKRIRDEGISIKMLLAIAWHKKESIDLTQSITRSIYRSLLKHPSFPLQKEVLHFLKNLSSLTKEQGSIQEKLEILMLKITEKGSGTEKMKARELERIAQLVFK